MIAIGEEELEKRAVGCARLFLFVFFCLFFFRSGDSLRWENLLDKKKTAGERPAHKDRYFSVEEPKKSRERNRRLFR
jgi:hypothetical protein